MLITLLLAGVLLGCTTGAARTITPGHLAVTVTSTQDSVTGLTLVIEASKLTVRAAESDRRTAQDVAQAIRAEAEDICAELQTPCQFSTVVEIYPDQTSFDQHVMNQNMRGYFALSGYPYQIQMVSPEHPAPHKISYQDGVQVAVHEFVHLALDEINPALPAWLDEGAAVYLGPHEPYAVVCQFAFPFELIPSFQRLTEAYEEVSAPDLFAYAAVDFIVHEYGMDRLNQLLRVPEDLESILGISPVMFDDRWQSFMQTQYHKRQTLP
jgi:RNA polymerase sigma-70 factor (ECF subfamily)